MEFLQFLELSFNHLNLFIHMLDVMLLLAKLHSKLMDSVVLVDHLLLQVVVDLGVLLRVTLKIIPQAFVVVFELGEFSFELVIPQFVLEVAFDNLLDDSSVSC